jgi:hypothetical protein
MGLMPILPSQGVPNFYNHTTKITESWKHKTLHLMQRKILVHYVMEETGIEETLQQNLSIRHHTYLTIRLEYFF